MKQVTGVLLAGLVAMAWLPASGLERTFTNNNSGMSVAGNWDPNGVPGVGDTGIIGGDVTPRQANFTDNLAGPPNEIVVRTNGTLSLQNAMTTEHNIVLEGGTLSWSGGNRALGSTLSLRRESCFLVPGAANNTLNITGLVQNAGAEAGRLIVTNASTNMVTGVTLGRKGGNTYSGGTVVYQSLVTLTTSNALGTGTTTLMPGSILRWAVANSQGSRILALGGKLQTGGAALTLTNRLSAKGDIELDSYGNTTCSLSGLIEDYSASETGRLVKTGSGYLTLTSGTNTYSGGTLVKEGILTLAKERSLGQGHVAVAGGAELRFGNTATAYVSAPTWPGWEVEVLSNATIRLLSSSSIYTTNVIVRPGGHIDGYAAGGNCASYDLVRIEGRVFLHRANATAVTYYRWYGTFRDGAVPGRLVFTGPSLATSVNNGFSGVNTYTGGTEIEDGGVDALPFKLLGNGRMPDVGEILVHTNGVMDFNDINDTVGGLAGVGRISLGKAVVTVNEGVSPGTNAWQTGVLTVTSTSTSARVTLAASSTNLFHLRTPGDQDQVVIQGAGGLTLGGAIKIAGAPTVTSGSYTLFDLNGGALSGTMPALILPENCSGSVVTNSGDVVLSLTWHPPGTLVQVR